MRPTSEVMQGWSISPPKRYVIQEIEAAHKLENKSKLWLLDTHVNHDGEVPASATRGAATVGGPPPSHCHVGNEEHRKQASELRSQK